MVRSDQIRHVFAQSSACFEDILFHGACGGAAAVRTYLMTRRQMLVREISRVLAQGDDALEHRHALSIFDQTLALLDKLVVVSHSRGGPEAYGSARWSGAP